MSRASESSNLSSSLRAASSYLVSRCNVTLGLEGRFSDLPRDFKSLVSRAPDCDSGCLKGHGFESRPVAMPQGFETPRGHQKFPLGNNGLRVFDWNLCRFSVSLNDT